MVGRSCCVYKHSFPFTGCFGILVAAGDFRIIRFMALTFCLWHRPVNKSSTGVCSIPPSDNLLPFVIMYVY